MMQARVGGVLEVSAHGFLIVGHGGTITDLVWPFGFSTAIQADGTVVVRDQAGHGITKVGQSFTAEGGWVPGAPTLRAGPTRDFPT
jgi:hypothetical protein